jgi:hypothetical protein
MALSLLVALAALLATTTAQQPETKQLFVSRGHINLVNNILHGTVRKILFPFANKIPRTISKRTHIHTSFPSYPGTPSYPAFPGPGPLPPFPPAPGYPTYPVLPFPSSYPGGVPSQTPSGSRTLDETLAADDRFTTLVAALTVAFPDSSNVLNGTSPLTIFAPTNSAFAKLGNDTLDAVLKDPTGLSTILQRHLVANKAVR